MLWLRFVISKFCFTTVLSTITVIPGVSVVSGQEYPNKPIRIVTTNVGGASDLIARQIAQGISGPLGQSVIVLNRGTDVSASETVATASADGYTLLKTSRAHWLAPYLHKVSYDPVKDFSPVTLVTSSSNVLVVNPSVPVKSVKELIDLAKAKPGELNYGSSEVGTSSHLAGELFKAMAGVKVVRINYKGAGPVVTGLLGGEVQFSFVSGAAVAPHLKSGALKAVAMTGAKPSPSLPGLPTISASGLPGYEMENTTAIFAPAKTPAAVINRLNLEIGRAINRPDVKERFFNLGVDVVGNSAEEATAYIKSDMAKMGKLIRDTGIRNE